MAWTGKPIVAVRAEHSTEGAYGAVTTTGAGTSAITAGATEPVDAFAIVVDFPVAGTIGIAGIQYRYSIDGGETFSRRTALGIANTITIPDTGATLALGAGTILAGEVAKVTTTAPALTNADLPAALEALRVTSSPFEAVYLDLEADDDTVGVVGPWLVEMNKRGRYPVVYLTARPRDIDGEETEAEYKDALDALLSSVANIDVIIGADLGDLASPVRGISRAYPAGFFAAARTTSLRYGVDPAYVALGPLPGVRITDDRGNPKYHDENLFPGLDELRATSLRTFDGEGMEGVYLTNVNLVAPGGSDYVFVQHARTLNRGCEIAHQILTKQLSRGVRKSPTVGTGGERYIAETDAQDLEGLVNAQLSRELVTPGEVDDIRFSLSRTDDIRSNAGATLTGRLENVSLGYAKVFDVTAGHVTEITPATPPGT